MHKTSVRLLGIALFLFVFGVMASAQDDFSGDIYNSQSGKEPSLQAKIYMAKDKLRIEPQQQQHGQSGTLILNFTAQTSDVLMPERKMYMEFPQGQGPMQRSFNFFRAGDVENACEDWQKMAPNRGGTCKKIGSETVNGRNTVKYEGTSKDGSISDVWLDPSLRFPIKWQGNNSGGELRNIKVGSQPASLFEIPAGFQKMEMPMGMPANMQHP